MDLDKIKERLTQAEVNEPPKAGTSSSSPDQCKSPKKSPTLSVKECPSPDRVDNRDSAKVSQGSSNNNNNSHGSPLKDGGRGLHRDSSQSIVTTGSKRSEASPSPIQIEEK